MVLIAWILVIALYLICGILYLQFPQLSPLGALSFPDTVNDLAIVIIIGMCGVCMGYLSFSKVRLIGIRDFNNPSFINFCSMCFAIAALLVFYLGVHSYGGYFSFIHTPYAPIYEGSAENETKDVLISSSGLLSIYALLTSIRTQIKNTTLFNKIVIIISLFVLISIFIQGRRENLILLIFCFISYYLLSSSINFLRIIKVLLIFTILFFIAGLGLYLRESTSTSGGSIITAIPFAIMYETHFSLATLANEVRGHLYNNLPYGGVLEILSPILFIIPAFIYGVLGLDKQKLFENTEIRYYEDKGGQFIFTEGFHSLGYVGVFIHGLMLGITLIVFYRIAKKSGLIIYHFPIVSLIFVAMRKDLTYGVKYISLLFIFMIFFYFVYKLLPLKTGKIDDA
ncbi:oligosaccharide repeat unit polymerase [Enterobacter chuandaensis]|uniref:O-antigen polymerase n=1 Tax=Enterobacter chuandaensis TaxID=2497875 RepID=UPI0032176F72